MFSVTLALALFSWRAAAVTITENSACILADAIAAANTDTATGGIPAGSGVDTIRLTVNITLSATLPSITSVITVDGNGSTYTID